ncbi:DUF262 domain-containing protein [Nostoc sp. MS1]|uniref:DUF262 domain-containing protein n=1 Tax=Nostoc sp. MS1 TaxID=2764711 RepID=UPI001CC56B23|nr:DUF262 domain-containing protein [Nostoc sp. MS1]BCL37530.1 hypothetical protein NSMS1_39770 [Nostoc sp. MS1]
MADFNNQNPELADEEILEEEENDEEQEEKITFQYDPEKINIVTREPTIELLLKRINEEALDLAPDFQRHANVWKEDAQSRLIESIIIRIPIPAFYIDATNEDKWLVVDGLQRLFALKRFILDKKLKLSGLEYLTNLEDKTFDQIERRYQRRLEETQLTVYLIEKGTPPEIKYNIFKRINTGGLALSPQELRHALNPGKGTKFLTRLAADSKFQQVVKLGNDRKMRMDDREFILGFLAFTLTPYKNYAGNRDTFLRKALSKTNKLSEAELNKIEDNFRRTMVAAWNIFGKNAFRKISNSQKKQFPINKALFESWSVILSNLSDEEIQVLIDKKEELINIFKEYVSNDKLFLESISQAAERVQYRFSTIETIIQKVLL